MIIVKLAGGLGNQLFQYALGRVLSIKNNTSLKMDTSAFDHIAKGDTKRSYELNVFNIKASIATKDEINDLNRIVKVRYLLQRYLGINLNPFHSLHVLEKSYNFQKEILNLGDSVYLDGYWQSEKYFKGISNVIRKDFTFIEVPNNKNARLLKQISGTNSVSIHVRRGDYVSSTVTIKFHGITAVEFYQKAAKIIRKQINKPSYFIFSDDIVWCQENFTFLPNVTFINHNHGDKSYEDLRLMSNCRHNIISNSSFSWWGAWLNDNPGKIVIAPKKWFNDPAFDIRDIIPKCWIKI